MEQEIKTDPPTIQTDQERREKYRKCLSTFKGSKFGEQELKVLEVYKYVTEVPSKNHVRDTFQRVVGYSQEEYVTRVYLKVLQSWSKSFK